jgi:hypothetical protein
MGGKQLNQSDIIKPYKPMLREGQFFGRAVSPRPPYQKILPRNIS